MINLLRRHGALLLLGLALALPTGAGAEVVKDLYTGQAPVADRSQKALAQAAQEALSQVLVKVSGSTEVLELPGIPAALNNAMSQAQQFSYARTDDPDQPLAARFEFSQGWVSGLLREAGAPLWTANRPSVLLWLVQDSPQGRQFVNRETAPELVRKLEADFRARGVPLRFPLFDLADAAALSPAQAWSLGEVALRQASARYRSDNILAGRLSELSGGQWLGDWAYFTDKDRVDRSASPESREDFLGAGAALVAETMAARYAVAAGAAPATGTAMTVSNVRSYADYAAIVSWLEGLELVEQARVEHISGDRLQLRLSAQADAGQLAALIQLNKRLVPATAPGATDELRYQWQNP
ncbi:DUF2066 domain-containing protein [Parahaliea mediterranea]|uniref:DUF2066 domain-containing protein n=1 Tax=Parahaliea mediterranea TaxID=651086 RepID=UPI001300774C|nr:DUF2066 domain-containing protein [Parahaliea mediterranea]